MDTNSLPTEFFIAQIKSFAEAFPTINILEEEWGLIFEWPKSTHITTNIALIYNEPKDNTEYLLNWLNGDSARKLLIPKGKIFQGKTVIEYELGIYYRKQKKINSPLLDTETIRSYSYRLINFEFNLKEIIDTIADISEIPDNSLFEFHRLIGGNMHLNEGEIWSLDNDGAVLSTALTVEQTKFKNIKLIELLATRKAVRRQGHAGNLMQSIISKGKKTGFIIIAKKTPAHEKLFEKYGFELIKLYDVHILNS